MSTSTPFKYVNLKSKIQNMDLMLAWICVISMNYHDHHNNLWYIIVRFIGMQQCANIPFIVL